MSPLLLRNGPIPPLVDFISVSFQRGIGAARGAALVRANPRELS